MKRLLFILFVFLPITGYGQMILSNGVSHYISVGGYCPEYQAVYNAMQSKPTESVASAQNTMVKTLVDGGVWSKLDLFYLFAVETNSNGEALLNWKDPSGDDNCTIVNEPTFTSLQGFTGNDNDYLNSNWTPNTEAVNWTTTSATIGVYLRLDQNVNTVPIGISTANLILPRNSGFMNVYIQGSSGTSTSSANSLGLFVGTRPNADSIRVYRNGVKVDQELKAQNTALSSNPLVILANTTTSGYSANEVACAFVGAALSSSDNSLINSAIETYMDSNSKGVQ